jgi:hypothetical protein
MRFAPTLLVALSIVAVSLPAQAQRVVRPNIRISFVIPSEYREAPERDTLSSGSELLFYGPDSLLETALETQSFILNLVERATIRLAISSKESGSYNVGEYSPEATRAYVDKLNRGNSLAGLRIDYQNSAKIKVAGKDAIAILGNFDYSDRKESITSRLIIVDHETKQYAFMFFCLNSEWDDKKVAFEKFINSIKFLTPPGTKPTPAPKKPRAKK